MEHPQKKSSPPLPDPSNNKPHRTRIIIHNTALQSEDRVEATKKSFRKNVVIGRAVHTQNDGSMRMGNLIFHKPSPFDSQTESFYFKGPPGAGKSWSCQGFLGQCFLGEGRTIVSIDTKMSYIGNNRPNLAMAKKLHEFGAVPTPIPWEQMDIIAPQYYVEALSPNEIARTWVTDYYKVPLRFCGVKQMFEMTKANRKAQYASTLDESFRDLLIRTNNKPKMTDVYDMIQEIVDDPDMKRLEWIYRVLLSKLQKMQRWTIEEGVEWSAVGNALFNAVQQSQRAGRVIPRWIVFTLGHAEHPEDDINLALVSAVLTEIYAFAKYARMHNLPIRLGVMMDELHTYVRNKDASAREAIHDLLFAWGRSNQVLRALLTQKDDQLDKVFRDDISNFQDKGTYTYSTIMACEAIPEPGYAMYINRLQPNSKSPDMPFVIPKLKVCPPLFEVESREPNTEAWLDNVRKRREEELRKKSHYYDEYGMDDADPLHFNPDADLRSF